jgi:hypothetical protein
LGGPGATCTTTAGGRGITQEVRTEIEKFLSMADAAMENIRAMIPVAVDLGVMVLPSTDREGTVADEIGRFVEYGMEPGVALRAARRQRGSSRTRKGSSQALRPTSSRSTMTLGMIHPCSFDRQRSSSEDIGSTDLRRRGFALGEARE